MLCDAHADTLWRMAQEPGAAYDLTLERLMRGGVSLQVLALFVGRDPSPGAVSSLVRRMLAAKDEVVRRGWIQADDPGEARDGEFRFMLSLEGCEPFGESLAAIHDYRRMGVRMAALTWNHENSLGVPASKNAADGLKPFGKRAIAEMNRLGIAVDVSHLNAAGFYDVLEYSTKPPLASHSCCRALRDHTRNLTDAQLKALFKAGGYVGVNFYPGFLTQPGLPCGLDSVVAHISHMMEMGGEGMVGFGSDFDGIESKPDGLEHPGHFPSLIQALREHGYSNDVVDGIAGKNFLRYYERIA